MRPTHFQVSTWNGTKMNKLSVIAVLASVACGCVSVNKNDGGDPRLAPPLAQDKVHLKYVVEKNQVKAADQMHCLFGFICWGSSATHRCDQSEGGFSLSDRVKDGAYANACDAAQCDQLVGARYKVTVDDYFIYAKGKAEVSGYPSKLVDVEVIDAVKHPEVPGVPHPSAKGGNSNIGSVFTSALRCL